jgi:hypothetical protein
MADSTSGKSGDEETVPTGFVIASDDAEILQEYLEEFEVADTATRTRIVERAMAQLYMLRPPNTGFNKVEARKVCNMHRTFLSSPMTPLWYRK